MPSYCEEGIPELEKRLLCSTIVPPTRGHTYQNRTRQSPATFAARPSGRFHGVVNSLKIKKA